MKTAFREITIATNRRIDLVDITSNVETSVAHSGIQQGICLVYLPHSTAAIVVNEHEAGLMQDIVKLTEQLFPENARWLHDQIDTNAPAHLAATMLGPSKMFPEHEGALIRGRWQNIFLLELDGPRSRSVIIQTFGE